ncbi:MAG: THUMP domain-containing protein, partial [Clostridium sp.]|nr:THUMP domain-containing protein [Clostridium sp.]
MFTAFLVKYAEIFVKGKNRYLFEEALVSQIRSRLKACDGSFLTKSTPGRIYVLAQSEFDYVEVTGALCKVFGVTAVCPVVELSDEGFEELCKRAASYVSQAHSNPNTTFKVAARRSRKNYPLTSTQINEKLGEALLAACPNLRVDVHHPDFYLNVEIRERIYLYSQELPGLGGMPLGTGGKAMLLLSGGIDSPVAGYMIAKRGVTIDAVYFHAPPYTSERAKQKVVDLTKIVSGYAGTIYLHVVNFSAIQMLIYDKCPHEELTIIMRRYMMRIAQRIAKDTQCH